MIRLLRRIFALLVLGLALCVLAAQFGQYDWRLELFSHFIPHYIIAAGVLSLFVIVLRQWMALLALAVVVTFCANEVYPLYKDIPLQADTEDPDTITILQWNVLYKPYRFTEKRAWLHRQAGQADIILLQEFTPEWMPTLKKLKKKYPYQYVYVSSDRSKDFRGAAVLSRIKGTSTELMDGETEVPYLRMQIKRKPKNRSLVLYAIHPPPPTAAERSHNRNAHLMKLAELIKQEKQPFKIIAGDFNITRYSYWFKKMLRVSGLKDTFIGNGVQVTWPSFLPDFMGIAIDHMLVSDNIIDVGKRTHSGVASDHKPVFTTLVLQ